ETLAITGHGFILDNDAAATYTAAQAKQDADIQAMMVESGKPVTNITVSGLDALNKAGKDGGIYPITFTAKDGKQEASITVQAVVKGDQTVIDPPDPDGETLAITADGFVKPKEQDLSDANAKTLSKVKAWYVESETEIGADKITVDPTELETINQDKEGIYPLTFTVKDGDREASATVQVVIEGDQTVIDPEPGKETLVITGHNFTVTNEAGKSLTKDQAITAAEVTAMLVESGTELTNAAITVEGLAAINGVSESGGIFELTFTADYKEQTAQITVTVIVQGDQTSVDPPVDPEKETLAIWAEGFVKEIGKELTLEGAKDQSKVKVWYMESGTDVTDTADISVNADQLAAINQDQEGVYGLTFTAIVADKDSHAPRSVSATVQVVVEGDQTEVDPPDPTDPDAETLAITADGFVKKSDPLTADEAKTLSKVKAWYVESNTEISEDKITVDAAELAAINLNKEGIYDLTFTVTVDGKEAGTKRTASVTVNVVVEGDQTVIDPDPTDPPDPDGETLVITGHNFTVKNEEAKNLTEAQAKAKAEIEAMLVESGTEITDITVEGLDALHQAGKNGGTYELTFTAKYKDQEASIKVIAVVEGDQTEVDPPDPTDPDAETLAITADGFVKKSDPLTADEAKTLSKVKAWYVESNTEISEDKITVDAAELAAINLNKEGIYDLTFTVTVDGKEAGTKRTASVTVNVVVEGDQTVIDPDPTDPPDPDGETLVITGHNFTVKNEEAKNLTEAQAKAKAEIEAMLVESGTEITDITVEGLDALRQAGEGGGIYELIFTATYKDQKASITVTAVVEGSQTEVDPPVDPTDPDAETLLVTAQGFVKPEGTLTETQAIDLANVKVWYLESMTEITDAQIQVNADQLAQINAGKEGVYDLTFTVTKDGQTAEVTVKVAIAGEGTVVVPDPDDPNGEILVLQAHNFEKGREQITAALAIQKAGANAWLLRSGKRLDDQILVNADQLAQINENRKSRYDLTFTVSYEAMKAETTVTVTRRSSGGDGSGGGSGSGAGFGAGGSITNGNWINDGYIFIKANGQKAANEWLSINGKVYRFTANGFMTRNYHGLTFGPDGALVNPWSADGIVRPAVGMWMKDGWWYQTVNGGYLRDGWYYLFYQGRYDWYYFDADGWMLDGWLDDKGYRYYLHTVHDGTRGHMYTGWHEIDGKWYYFRKKYDGGVEGSMIINGLTPDGYWVGSDGAWDGKKKNVK
ncbi:MAG: N-acetylmuramoyl-L-alanine amidase family protein, partial [Lachnospiraceae bacterium]